MNINKLKSQLKFVNQIGATLNIQQKYDIFNRINLQLSIIKLTQAKNYDMILFWGKIQGVYKNYYICVGINYKQHYKFPSQNFYWRQSFFIVLKIFNFQNYLLINLPSKYFSPPSYLQDSIKKQSKEVPDQLKQTNDQNILIPQKNFTQLDRLSIVVHTIQHDCQLIPNGSYKLTPTHQYLLNSQFKGLNYVQAKNLSSYQHYRPVQNEMKKKMIGNIKQLDSDEAVYKQDFLDPLTDDKPKGCWTIQTDASGTNITVRSLLWPGYVGYNRINSNIFGGVYIGDGLRTSDFHFII